MKCSIVDCDNYVLARGWCRKHYLRWHKTGDPEKVKKEVGFWTHVVIQPEGCWEWTGNKIRTGYGACSKGRTGEYSALAHRRAYQMIVGPVPEGLELDHLCSRRSCINPDHLEPVTHQENIMRGHQRRRAS